MNNDNDTCQECWDGSYKEADNCFSFGGVAMNTKILRCDKCGNELVPFDTVERVFNILKETGVN
jgi:hypothetical protein